MCDHIRFVLEVNLERRVSTNDDLPNVFYAMSVELVQLEGVLVREVPKASAASMQCLLRQKIQDARCERLKPSVVI